MSEESKECQCRGDIADMKRLLYGDPSTGRGGLAHSVETIGQTLYGTERLPGGLVSDVSSIKKTIWVATGIVGGLQVIWPFISPIISRLLH